MVDAVGLKKDFNFDISIIITVHSEGRLSHKTMMSVLKAAEQLDKNNVSYEIIVSMDNPTDETIEYYGRYKNDKRFKLIQGSYGNVSDSRNAAISKSQGKYVALLDGDDMVSSSWYIDSYRLAETKDGLFVLHPNVQLQFGVDEPNNLVWFMGDSFDKEKDATIMVQFNRWVSALFAPRKVFDKVMYKRPVNGYGYEDYCFDADTVAAGIKHFITPHTVFFYRRMITGKQNEHIMQHTVLPYTDLFDFENVKKWTIPNNLESFTQHVKFKEKVKQATVLCYGQLKSYPLVKKVVNKTTGGVKRRLYHNKKKALPSWLLNQWKEINNIDNQLWPTDDAIRTLDFHPRSFDQDGFDATRVGYCYASIVRQFTKNPDYIFFTYDPLGAGGTEKVLVNYIKALKQSHPDWHFAIIRKKPANFPFDLPDGVDFVDFDGITNGMHEWEKEILFDRIIVQSRAKRLHFFFNGWANSDFSFRWVKNHKKLLSKNDYHIYVSWFMREFVPSSEKGRIMSFGDPYLEEVYDCVDYVFTDNQAVIDETLSNNAFDKNKFVVHHQPMSEREFVEPKTIDSNKPLKVLWASRLSYQKRPDILRQIAQCVDSSKIIIDAYGREQNYSGSYLSGIESLSYKGEFKGLSSLQLADYDVFLYTSQVDGMPNVLLEATAAGLPIVASDDGGVSELIKNNKTGKLVDIDDIDGYITALIDLHDNPQKAANFVRSAQKIVKKVYTWKEFNLCVNRDIN